MDSFGSWDWAESRPTSSSRAAIFPSELSRILPNPRPLTSLCVIRDDPKLVSSENTEMPDHSDNKAENVMNNIIDAIAENLPKQKSGRSIMDTIAENLPKQKSGRFDEGSVSAQMNKLFGRQKSIHRILGGGKSADVLLWWNKKISSSVLALATAIWVFFEWLDYHFLTIVCFVLVVGMVVQFVWSNFASMLSRSPPEVPRVKLPDELFANIAVAVGGQVNKFLGFIQDVSCGRNLKEFLMVILGLWAAAMIGSWFNFLTVIFIGFVCAHTLPVLYEKYEDQVDEFFYNLLGLLRSQYKKFDDSVLSKIPKGNTKSKKSE